MSFTFPAAGRRRPRCRRAGGRVPASVIGDAAEVLALIADSSTPAATALRARIEALLDAKGAEPRPAADWLIASVRRLAREADASRPRGHRLRPGPGPLLAAPAGPAKEAAVMARITAATAANDAAAAYQRLRGHLAYLGLNAAADALPGLLDDARDGHVTRSTRSSS